jgi:hypothetical protein
VAQLLTWKSFQHQEKLLRNQESKRHEVAEKGTPLTPTVVRTTKKIRVVAAGVVWRSDSNVEKEEFQRDRWTPTGLKNRPDGLTAKQLDRKI